MLLRKKIIALFVLLSFVLTSCEFKCSVGDKTDKKQDDKDVTMKDGTAVFNGISLDTKGGVRVQRAYLVNSKNERLGENNFVAPNETVKLVLMIDSGWTEEEGRCYLGASEKAVTDAGYVILDEADLFASTGVDGISPKDAKIIALSVILKLRETAPPNRFDVSFRVWDKKGAGEITGSYKLNTK